MSDFKFTFIDLFSGIGGFHFGLAELKGKCLMASEILPIASQNYNDFFDLKPHGDISEIDVSKVPDFDLLCAGFPCQAFSSIGKKQGFNDKRGQMIYEVFRFLEYKQPKAFILENVKGLVSHDNGQTLSYIVEQLKYLNYDVKYDVLEAKDFGLPQIRKRLFIVGVKSSLNIEFEFPKPVKLETSLSEVLGGKVERDYAYTIRIGGRRSGYNNKFNWDAYMVNDEIKYITPEQCMRLQGFPKTYVLKGTQSQKYHLVGNSVPSTIVREIGRKLIELNVI